jgi:signal transduction histidine kinase
MTEVNYIRSRMRRTLAVGMVCIVVWMATLQIRGSAVFYYLERFALHDDGRYLLASASTLVSLNTLRAVFLYVGWFNLGDSLSHLSNRWRFLAWLVPLVGVPCSYALISQVQGGLSLHFGAPAVFSIVTVIVMQMTTREIKGWIARLIVIALLVFAIQWLDLAPMLSHWGFGGGELSSTVKEFALVADWGWVLDALSFGMFFSAAAGGVAAAALLVGASQRNANLKKIRERDLEIATLREDAIQIRSHREVQQLVHDLARPLTTILGLADVIADSLPPGDLRRYAERISRSGANMNQMINELLREEARQRVPVSELFEYVLSQVSAFDWRHSVTVSAEDPVLAQRIHINLIRLSRAVVNLLDNANLAVRDSPVKEIRLSATVDNHVLLLSVIDSGPGFSETYSSHTRGVSEWGSTGIGLAFVEEVAKNHGGSLLITNGSAGGAVVRLQLPVNEEDR